MKNKYPAYWTTERLKQQKETQKNKENIYLEQKKTLFNLLKKSPDIINQTNVEKFPTIPDNAVPNNAVSIQKIEQKVAENYNKGFYDNDNYYGNSFEQKKTTNTIEYQPSTEYKDLIPVFLDNTLLPFNASFIDTFIGSSDRIHHKEWLIIKDYETFIEIIPELFGKFDKPTKIPLALSLAFFLSNDIENTNYIKEIIEKNEKEEFIKNIGAPTISPSSFYDPRRSKIREVYKPKKDEKTGYDCAQWLIENNYIPEVVNVHDVFYVNNFVDEISPLMSKWQKTNNVRVFVETVLRRI